MSISILIRVQVFCLQPANYQRDLNSIITYTNSSGKNNKPNKSFLILKEFHKKYMWLVNIFEVVEKLIS